MKEHGSQLKQQVCCLNKTKEKATMTQLWNQSQLLIRRKELELADRVLMSMIWRLADYTLEGYKDSYEIDDVQIGEWKEKAWICLEENGLLPWHYE